MPKYEGDKDYTVEFTPVAVNICNFKNVFRTRALLRLLLETFLNQLEEKLVCPLKKVETLLLLTFMNLIQLTSFFRDICE